MMLRNRKRQKVAKLKAEEEEKKKPKIIPYWKKAAMEALKQERERIEKENLDDGDGEGEREIHEDAMEVEAKPAYFNDFIAQAKRLDSSLKSSLDLDLPVQRQSSEGEDEAEVGEEIERKSLMRETMMMYRVKGVAAQTNMNPYEVLPGYSRNNSTLGSGISKSKSMSMNMSNMSNMTNMSNMPNMSKMSMSMNLSIHQLGLSNSRSSMVLSQPVILSPH